MTDITHTAPITFRPWFLLRMKFPKWAPKWVAGSALANSSEAIGRAFEMAYVAPFCASKPTPLIGPDEGGEGLAGRDPNW